MRWIIGKEKRVDDNEWRENERERRMRLKYQLLQERYLYGWVSPRRGKMERKTCAEGAPLTG